MTILETISNNIAMSKVTFSAEEKAVILPRIQHYVQEELDQEIGRFAAEFLLDFFSEEIGSYFYNRGLYDAQAILESRLDSVKEAIYELEKPTDLVR